MEQLEWCIKKLEAALADYNMEDATNYLAMLKLWKDKLK